MSINISDATTQIIINKLLETKFTNRRWYAQVIEFLAEHPEFNKLMPIVAIDEYPIGFNKNPNENNPNSALNIFETLLFGISISNVPQEEGRQKFVELANYYRNVPFFYEDMIPTVKLDPKKLKVYQTLVNQLIEAEINPLEMTIDDLYIPQRIIGIGDSVLDLVYLLYADASDERCVPHLEEKFVEGMERLYKKKMTPQEIKEKTDTWKNKKVGVMFATQYAYFHQHLGEK
jgi:hypothetical protein